MRVRTLAALFAAALWPALALAQVTIGNLPSFGVDTTGQHILDSGIASAKVVIAPTSSVGVGELTLFNSTVGNATKGTGGLFYGNTNGIAAGYGFPPLDKSNIFNLKNVYVGGGTSPTAVYGIVDYKYNPGSPNADNMQGLYGSIILDAPVTHTGLAAGIKGNGYTTPQLTATVQLAGTGYTNGDVVSIVGGTCTTLLNVAPQFTLTVSGGVVTAATFVSSGTGGCTVYPGNPVAVTGGTGAGLTLNLSNGTLNATYLVGAYGRCRHVSLGTVTNCIGLMADGGYNSGGGNTTNQIGVFIQPPYDTNYGSAYGILFPAAGCSPGCWNNGTIVAGADPIFMATQTAGQGMLFSSQGAITLQTPSGGYNVTLKPLGTSVTQIVASGSSTLPLSGSAASAGLYPYMLSTGAGYIDALVAGGSSSTLHMRTYAGGGVYNDSFFIGGGGIVGIGGVDASVTPSLSAFNGVQIGAATGGYKGNGSLNIQGTIWTNGTQGIATKTCTVNQALTLIFTNGILTGGTCNA